MKTKIKTILLVLVSIVFAGNHVVAGDANNKSNVNRITSHLLNPQDKGKYGKDSAQCVMNLSLYREFYKQWKSSDYKSTAVHDAIGSWRWVFANCPEASQNTYLDGLTMHEFFLKNSKVEAEKAKYLDTMMMIYDQRIKYFGREGYNLGRKGSDLFKYSPEDFEKAYYIFKKSVDQMGNKSESFVLVYYFRTVIKMIEVGKLEKSVIVDTYDQLSGIIDHNLVAFANEPAERSDWENVKGNIELSFEPYATCEDLIDIYTKKFNENPTDVALLKKITSMLDKKDCTNSQLFFDASVKLNELEPSPISSYMIAKMLVKKEEYSKSIPYLEAAIAIENEDTKADVYLLLCSVFLQNKNYSTARDYGRKTLDLRPNDGHAYLMIGDMYAASADECGDNDVSKKAGFWAAVDKYVKAKQSDPELEETAQKRIEIYSRQFPTVERLFFYGLAEGEQYTVGCWINEKTTIRAAK